MFFSPHGLDPLEEGSAAILLRAVMRDHDIAAWADAVEVEQALRKGVRGIRGEVLLHRSYVPLDEADYRRPLVAVSSTSGRTNARGCGVSEDRERRRGGQSVPPPLRAAALRLLRLPFLPRRRVENSRNPGLRPSLCSFLRCSSSLQIPPCPLRGAAARSRPGRAGPAHLVPPPERKLHDHAAPAHPSRAQCHQSLCHGAWAVLESQSAR